MHHNLINRKLFIETGLPPTIIKKAPKNAIVEAIRLNNMLVNDPKIKTQTDLANELGISNARVNQILVLLKLQPEIRMALIDSEDDKIIKFFSDKKLRKLLKHKEPKTQILEFERLKKLIS